MPQRPAPNQGTLEIGPDVVSVLSLHDCMEVVVASHGFMPHTKDELREVVGIDAFPLKQGGVARHLNEVLRHGQKPHVRTDDPKLSVQSITQEYAWFAEQAHEDTRQLLEFNARFGEMFNPSTSIYDYLCDEVAPEEVMTQSGITQLIRFVDLKRFTETGNEMLSGFDVLKKHSRERGEAGERRIVDVYHQASHEPLMRDYVVERLKAVKVGDLRTMSGTDVEAAVDDSINRFEYWIAVLQQARQHLVARPIAEAALHLLIKSK